MSLKPPIEPTTDLVTLGTHAVKPPSGRVEVYVDNANGSDSHDGKSWGTALATIGAALTGMPNGGKIWVAASADEYTVTSSLSIDGHSIEGVCRVPGGTQSIALIRKNFNGDLLDFGANGGHVKNIHLYANDTPQTGAAINAESSASNGGDILFENVVVSGGVGFERNVVLDGSAWVNFGIRKCVFDNCQFFGVRTAGESMVITRGVHIVFKGGFQDEARVTDGGFGTVSQGIRIIDVGTTGVEFLGFRLIGTFYTEAGGDLLYVGQITGNVTCASGSDLNTFMGRIGGTFTNSGGTGNQAIAPSIDFTTTSRIIINKSGAGNAFTIRNGSNNLLNIPGTTPSMSFADGAGGSLDTTIARSGAGIVEVTSAVRMGERTDPSAPGANAGILYVRDNGSGKSQLVVRFPTGAIQVIATEP